MTGLLNVCKKQFGSSNLYEVIGVEADATDSQLKKGYHKVSLKVHPDRCEAEEKEEATRKFQTLGRVYKLLADKDLRSVYDETGEVAEEESSSECKDWQQYWRTMFKVVTVEDIKNFDAKYKESEEEQRDLEQAYCEHSGDMDKILSCVILSSVEDEERFRVILDAGIEEGRLPEFEAYKPCVKKTNKRKRAAAKEAKEASEVEDSMASLIAKIQGKGASSESFLDGLAQKYAAKPKGKGKKNK